ncbi:MAG: hypothetical protein IPM64_04395 [Phycisphaerales bacterium]|nr:hypothetical protein [Phycisphaerales bacterium]
MIDASAKSRAIVLTLLVNAAAWIIGPWLLRDGGEPAGRPNEDAGVEHFSEHLRIWNDVQTRADAAAVLNRAAAFAQLEPDQRSALRGLHEIVESVMRAAAPAQRSYFLKLPPAARAVEIGRELREHHPEKLAQALALFAPAR